MSKHRNPHETSTCTTLGCGFDCFNHFLCSPLFYGEKTLFKQNMFYVHIYVGIEKYVVNMVLNWVAHPPMMHCAGHGGKGSGHGVE